MKKTALSLVLGSATLALAAPAFAQGTPAVGLPKETTKASSASTGKTEIATGGTFAAASAADDAKELTEASLAAGGLFSSGNARTVAVTAAGKVKIRRDEHQFTGAAAANYARAGKAGTPVDTTVENYQGLLRYDYFFGNAVSLFLQSSGRNDRFQGLDFRLNVDPGIAYYFVNEKARRLNVELGYDLQHDIRRDASRVVPVAADAPAGTQPTVLPKTQTLHNVRAFVGFENKIYKEVGFLSSLEYLQNVEDLGTYRLIFDVGLKSNISNKLAIATTYTMRYENKPLPSVFKADSIASVNLVYTLF